MERNISKQSGAWATGSKRKGDHTMKRRLLWHVFAAIMAVVLFALGSVTIYGFRAFRRFYLDEVRSSLRSRAELLVPDADRIFQEEDGEAAEQLCESRGSRAGIRITVMLPSGKVLGDSDEDATQMDNHRGRPEVQKALQGEVGSRRRFSNTVRKNMMYVAVPVVEEGELMGIVRTSVPLLSLRSALTTLQSKIAIFAALIFMVVAGVSLLLSRRIARPLERMQAGAKAFAAGDFDHHIHAEGAAEINSLSSTLNTMADELRDKISALERRNSEQKAVLASMREGVIALDAEGCILAINPAGGDLLNVHPTEVRGMYVEEAIRHSHIQDFIHRTLAAEQDQPVEKGIELGGQDDTLLQARGTALKDSEGNDMGALVVLNDVTKLRKLERIRRDFVANVSHELKTPITAIKGFVETLREDGLEDREQAKKFLNIVAQQAKRLNAIIRDLMSLARIEQGEGGRSIDKEETRILPVIKSAVRDCSAQADEKDITVDVECSDDSTALIKAPLLEQAVTNLIDNAIKYSDSGSSVRVEIQELAHRVAIHVHDNGCGISTEHLPRIFERFYRTDKARSRKLGGTGLGLSIVKHVAQLHGGSVDVKSTVGKGSTFSIYLPLCEQD